ncbi:MAG: redox-sensing transcriptional repressor Rex [Kiritimatiellae bacterium]|nr:redox-sensing transcriptional repressor Rex [Kiritimatiellia bacterium]
MIRSLKVIERLSLYRRVLLELLDRSVFNIYSSVFAKLVNGTPAQVRRDIMELGFAGDQKTGYNVESLIAKIGEFLDHPDGENVALVGVGNLGCALVNFLSDHHRSLKVVAAFDSDPDKADGVICECRCYALEKMEEVFLREHIRVVVLSVPVAVAQDVAELAVQAGAVGVLNFAPVLLSLPDDVFVRNMDMMVELEMVSYLARQSSE